jgi:ectoine hydroxylase-related dioxygenase (phytanoyl-CoA dioxygenase family)
LFAHALCSGWARAAGVVEAAALDAVIAETSSAAIGQGGLRDLLAISSAASRLARHPLVRDAAEAVLGPDCFVVRSLLFDKTDAANWKVAWHQDLTIAVAERIELPGFGPWSIKAGIVHVQPPVTVLARMLAVRVHLDDCNEENGPLRVIPGSHRSGRLAADAIAAAKEATPAVTCAVARGGILLFRPLLLHASSEATQPRHRRVVHFEFAAEPLPGCLKWHSQA